MGVLSFIANHSKYVKGGAIGLTVLMGATAIPMNIQAGQSQKDAAVFVSEESNTQNAKNNWVLATFNKGIDDILGTQAQNYPITAAVNKYIAEEGLNEKFEISKDKTETTITDNVKKGQTGVEIGAAGALGVSSVNMLKALSLGNKALGLGAKAKELAAAAKAAAAEGNYAKAVALGNQAKATGAKAMKLGERAKNAAHVAKVLTYVSGGIAVVDGGIDLYRGIHDMHTVNKLKDVANSAFAKAPHTETTQNKMQKDYDSVMQQLDKLAAKGVKRTAVGGAKTAFGTILLIAPATGPAAPIVGTIGSMGYLGTIIYDHKDEIVKFAKTTFDPHTTKEFDENLNKQREREAIAGDWTP